MSACIRGFSNYLFFFFFSSRRRHTRFDCDWSSDVCSSDLPAPTISTSASSCSRCAVTILTSAILSKSFGARSEEHTSELQSQSNLVCRLLLEKKNNTPSSPTKKRKTLRLPESDRTDTIAVV